MTRRREYDLERRLADLEEQNAQTPCAEFDLSPLSLAEKKILDQEFSPDTPRFE